MNLTIVIKIIGVILFIYFLIVFYIYLKQRSLLYIPNIDNYDDEPLRRSSDLFPISIPCLIQELIPI